MYDVIFYVEERLTQRESTLTSAFCSFCALNELAVAILVGRDITSKGNLQGNSEELAKAPSQSHGTTRKGHGQVV